MNEFLSLADDRLLITLWDAALKGTILLILAGAAASAAKRASAAARHLIFSASLVGALCLPILSLLLPEWRVPWMPQWIGATSLLSDENLPPVPFPAAESRSPSFDEAVRTPEQPQSNRPPIADLVEANADHTTPLEATAPTKLTVNPARIAAAVWFAGLTLSLAPLAIGTFLLARLTRRSALCENATWNAQAAKLGEQLHLHRTATLRTSDRVRSPLTWGAWRPVLLLPVGAQNWSPERRRVVLLHELAHVKRFDWLTQTLAYVACAIYWFNPLAWWAARRMRVEREAACDDVVLAAGSRPTDYADELLKLASAIMQRRLVDWAAVPMARRSTLEGRLLAILDGTRNRAALTRAVLVATLMILAAVAVPVAMMRAAPELSETQVASNKDSEKNKTAGDATNPKEPATEKPAEPNRKFVHIVVGPGALTFEGQSTTWEQLPELLAKVPDRAHTVLALAISSDTITVGQLNELQSRNGALAKQHGFEYPSYIGVHPLGYKGTAEQQRGAGDAAKSADDVEGAVAFAKKWLDLAIGGNEKLANSLAYADGKFIGEVYRHPDLERFEIDKVSVHTRAALISSKPIQDENGQERIFLLNLESAGRGDPPPWRIRGGAVADPQQAREMITAFQAPPLVDEVVEKTLHLNKNEMLDLDSGIVYQAAKDWEQTVGDPHRWLGERGIDLLVAGDPNKQDQVIGVGGLLLAKPVDNDQWERGDKQSVKATLTEFDLTSALLRADHQQLPVTYAIRTMLLPKGDPHFGLLQLVSLDAQNQTVSIRYRLFANEYRVSAWVSAPRGPRGGEPVNDDPPASPSKSPGNESAAARAPSEQQPAAVDLEAWGAETGRLHLGLVIRVAKGWNRSGELWYQPGDVLSLGLRLRNNRREPVTIEDMVPLQAWRAQLIDADGKIVKNYEPKWGGEVVKRVTRIESGGVFDLGRSDARSVTDFNVSPGDLSLTIPDVKPGAYTIRQEYRFKVGGEEVSVTSGVVAINIVQKWSDVKEGVSVRLRAAKRLWSAGETPQLFFDVRSSGKPAVARVVNHYHGELEVDGARYAFVPKADVEYNLDVRPLDRQNEITFALTSEWQNLPGKIPLQLSPGVHVIRFTPEVHTLEGGYIVRGGMLQAISNPVEIEIAAPALDAK